MDESAPGPVERYRHDLEVVRLTAELVARDFAAFGIRIAFSGNENTAYEELNRQVVDAVHDLAGRQPEALQALLYRIDVGEAAVRNLQGDLRSEENAVRLSRLILERELTKAVFRKLYERRR